MSEAADTHGAIINPVGATHWEQVLKQLLRTHTVTIRCATAAELHRWTTLAAQRAANVGLSVEMTPGDGELTLRTTNEAVRQFRAQRKARRLARRGERNDVARASGEVTAREG